MCLPKEEQQTAPVREGTPTFEEFIASLPHDKREKFTWTRVNEKERVYAYNIASAAVVRETRIENVLFLGVRPGPGSIDIHYVVFGLNGGLAVARIPFNPFTDTVSWLAGDGEPAFAL